MNKERMIELAQGQLDAYNKRDLENFCSFYHPEIELFDVATNKRNCSGMKEFREIFTARFENNPNLHCELKSRIVLNNSVLDEEYVTGGGPVPTHVVAIYHFKDNLIISASFTR